jgi:hypothetical protein
VETHLAVLRPSVEVLNTKCCSAHLVCDLAGDVEYRRIHRIIPMISRRSLSAAKTIACHRVQTLPLADENLVRPNGLIHVGGRQQKNLIPNRKKHAGAGLARHSLVCRKHIDWTNRILKLHRGQICLLCLLLIGCEKPFHQRVSKIYFWIHFL